MTIWKVAKKDPPCRSMFLEGFEKAARVDRRFENAGP